MESGAESEFAGTEQPLEVVLKRKETAFLISAASSALPVLIVSELKLL